ncbi:asparagine synthase-related protein [Amycolatopsis sp. NPDC059021]|uniref:asparagine synthase-related protein n=1 Tax=Amycolatopsis sp. NPDC059021 TaxID=3346704 RepID=UPI003670DECB
MNPAEFTGEWIVVVPDHPRAATVAERLGPVPRRLDHPSGRPWLLGSWESADLRVGAPGGKVSIAVLGFCSASTGRLAEIAARTGDTTGLDSFSPAGSFHLFASVHGATRVQGGLSGLRRVFRVSAGGITFAATRADALAVLIGAEVDERQLALRFLLSEIPLHTMNSSLWQGVHAVEEDSCLIIGQDGQGRVRRRWEPPVDDQPLTQAAGALRTALAGAVQTRLASGLRVTADLSGGLDSTPLCFLASRGGRPLTTITKLGADVGDDDPLWADLAAEHLPHLDRVLLSFSELPSHYSDLLDRLPAADEPFPCVEDRPMYRAIAARAASAGSQVHLTGDGGDETLRGGGAGVFELLRTRPMTALRHLRAYRAFEHWRWRDIGSYAWERRYSYPRWLAKRARTIVASSLEDEGAANLVQLPPWATPRAVELVRDLLSEEAERARRHGHNWTAHHTIWGIRLAGTIARATVPLYAAHGIRVTSPYLDDAVIEACMAARAHERHSPWRYKPLLVEAMRGIVPDRCLARTTKADGANVEHAGMRTNLSRLAALCDESRLGHRELIDPAVLREVCTSLNVRLFTPYAISITLSCERWLRDLEPIAAGASPREVSS